MSLIDFDAWMNSATRYPLGWGPPRRSLLSGLLAPARIKIQRRLSEKGDALSQYVLGRAYVLGDGVSENLVEGYVWVYIAWRRIPEYLEDEVQDVLFQIEERMTYDQQHTAMKYIQLYEKKFRTSFLAPIRGTIIPEPYYSNLRRNQGEKVES
ncbi:MAG: hypothetical protein WC959_12700 [Kiritimatiellales bacterium]